MISNSPALGRARFLRLHRVDPERGPRPDHRSASDVRGCRWCCGFSFHGRARCRTWPTGFVNCPVTSKSRAVARDIFGRVSSWIGRHRRRARGCMPVVLGGLRFDIAGEGFLRTWVVPFGLAGDLTFLPTHPGWLSSTHMRDHESESLLFLFRPRPRVRACHLGGNCPRAFRVLRPSPCPPGLDWLPEIFRAVPPIARC